MTFRINNRYRDFEPCYSSTFMGVYECDIISCNHLNQLSRVLISYMMIDQRHLLMSQTNSRIIIEIYLIIKFLTQLNKFSYQNLHSF